MRHGMAGNKLSRNSTLRKVTLRDMAKAILIHQQIKTTKTRAKEARKLVEQLISLGKRGTLADKRRAFAILCDHQLVSDLFNKTSPRFKNRVGGYTRIVTLGTRRGDNAQLALLELTEKEIIVPKVKPAAMQKSKTIDVTPAKQESNVEKTIGKDDADKKDNIKSAKPNPAVKPDSAKPGKNVMGGLRKMFNRKAPGQ